MSAASEMAEYTAAAFYSYEAMRDARDEALCRVQDLTDERDQARRIAASLEAEVAAVRELHAPRLREGETEPNCWTCGDRRHDEPWPCLTAEAVYLP